MQKFTEKISNIGTKNNKIVYNKRNKVSLRMTCKLYYVTWISYVLISKIFIH